MARAAASPAGRSASSAKPPRIGTARNIKAVAAEVLRLGEDAPRACATGRTRDGRRCCFMPVEVAIERAGCARTGPTNGSQVERAVRRDPLARVQVEAAVAVDLHVLRGVGGVPPRGDRRERRRPGFAQVAARRRRVARGVGSPSPSRSGRAIGRGRRRRPARWAAPAAGGRSRYRRAGGPRRRTWPGRAPLPTR